MSRFCKVNILRSIFSTNVWIFIIVLVSSLAHSHIIHKRHDIIENLDSSEHVNSPDSEKRIAGEHDSTFLEEGDIENIGDTQIAKDVINNDENNNVNTFHGPKVPSSTDVNNGIEQNYDSHIKNNTPNVNETIDSSVNKTKDFSQESIENSLPSNSDKYVSKIATLKDTAKSVESKFMQSTNALPQNLSTTLNSSDKPKRNDVSFAKSTERAVPYLDTSTIPISRSTVSMLSTVPLTPKISATETIRARISSISPEVIAEKRAKYLSEPHIGSTSPSSHSSETSWSDLKTVGEVHHNNVTLGRPLAQEESIKLVNGKLDSEEIPDKGAIEGSATEKSTEEHETQLQKSNTSRINDVPEDNSLSSLQSSSNRPTIPVTKRAGPTKSVGVEPTTLIDASHQSMRKVPPKETELHKSNPGNTPTDGVKIKSTEVESTTNVYNVDLDVIAVTTTEHMENDEESTIRTTDEDVYSTTEVELTTTVDDGETTILDETTTMNIVSKSKLDKTKGNMVSAEITPIVTTTDENETVQSTIKQQKDKASSESNKSVVSNDISKNTTEPIETSTTPLIISTTLSAKSGNVHLETSTTPFVSTEIDPDIRENTHQLPNPTKPNTTKSTQTNQKIIVPSTEPVEVQHERTNVSNSSSTRTISTTQIHGIDETTQSDTKIISPRIKSTNGSVSDLQKGIENRSTAPEHQTEIAQVPDGEPTDVNAMIAIGISVVAVVTLILLVGFLFVMRKRQKQLTYGQRCRPIGLDAYSLDNISVYNSVRRKSAIRMSKRAFGNAGFDDPGLKNNPLNISQLATFSQKRVSINDEFRDIPTVTARIEEVPVGCEDKNRYANVVPLPESRVHLKRLDDDEKTEYINANFVKGPKDTTHYYIACQAPLEHTLIDFWRMIWEQNSRVIIMATDLTENGIEKCAEYLPSTFVIDNHVTFGDYQIILKNREVRDKYAVSTVHLKNACTKTWREITHFWYQWPENGVPNDEASTIAMLLEARSYLKMVTPEQKTENGQQESDFDENMSNENPDKTKSLQRVQGPLTVHCSPGTGRTGTIIACDIAIRSLEQPTRTVDIPQIVYFVRRGRASAVQTREQYEFIYKVAHVYATKLTGPVTDN